MNLETEVLKTNEFLRRRKLRLQQVREQSKDIAKKIRQRTKVEKLRQVVDIDAKKQKEYLDKQEKLVKQLEVLYVRGLGNVGVGHQSATDLIHQDEVLKEDLSKVRGKEAAAELRRTRQQKLNEQKKLLDRKLQAREAANELSREKSSVITNKLISKPTKVSEDNQKPTEPNKVTTKEGETSKDEPEVKTSDMATQWDVDTLPNEWEPTVPALALPKDDKDSVPEYETVNLESKSDKTKRLDLFALSKEMPSSLRGKHTETIERNPVTMRPSLTLVSEYLQSRKLRLRETAVNVSKPSDADIHNLKQTIQRTRTSKPDEVSGKFRSNTDKSSRDTLNRKPSVMMYNHSTKDKRDMPCGDGNLVVRDLRSEEDAYSHALRETSGDNNERDKVSQKKMQDMRTKVAVAKQTVEKEYKETMNFLKNMPKSSGKVIKTAYMDEHRQQMQREHKQRKMQNEFMRIERECTRPISHLDNSRSKSKSPKRRYQDDLENRDFQYSWMPVPEGDGNLVIHTIPNTIKEGKNNVKFSQVDSYHEYRSRHKHTPPTKDKTSQNQTNKKTCEAGVIDKDTSDSTDTSTSDTSSVENLRLEKKPRNNNPNDDTNLSDAERIIIYKILDSKKDKKCKKQTKLLNNIAKSLSSIEKASKPNETDKNRDRSGKTRDLISENTVSLEQINEGIYKVVDQQGDNVNPFNIIDDQPGPSKIVTTPGEVPCQQCQFKHPDKINKNTLFQWQSGDELPRANDTCKCNTSEEKPIKAHGNINLSPSNSISSFKTATNDRINNVRPDGGFIKLIDEAGHEAGKFFIGASSILSDNAYEVVIQLRKKDDSKKETDDNKGQAKQPICINLVNITKTNEKFDQEVNKQHTNSETHHNENASTSKELNEVLTAGDVSEKAVRHSPNTNQSIQNNDKGVNTTFQRKTCNKDESETSIESSDNICLLKRYDNKQNMVDKCVYTSFLVNDQIRKSDPISRPATTTFTQTSSPRPKYHHMSSSTSTAYMSPPEMILPQSIRRVSGKPQNDFEQMTDEHEFCDRCSDCDCKKCQKARLGKDKTRVSKLILTPPNSPLSNRKIPRYINNQDVQSHNKINNICKSKCSKCASRDQIKGFTFKNILKNRTTETHTHKSVPKPNMRCAANAPLKTYKKTMKRRQGRLNSNLNPLVKNYVDKLLTLSKESSKALEVADQDCSSIPTPGSSIINVPFNIDEKKTSLRKICLEQIKNAFEHKLVKDNAETKLIFTKNFATRTGSKTRTCRKRSVHKVKSFNVSKNLLKKHKLPESKSKRMLSLTSTDDNVKIFPKVPNQRRISNETKARSKTSPTPRIHPTRDLSESSTRNSTTTEKATDKGTYKTKSIPQNYKTDKSITYNKSSNQSEKTFASKDSENIKFSCVYKDSREVPISTSTQTNENIEDANFMKLAEDKLNNMEKIADLTEKCTKRLSNLARVLDEVRKSKSLAYSHISASDSTGSQSDNKSDKAVDSTSVETDIALQTSNTKKTAPASTEKEEISHSYISFLNDIPKPAIFKIPEAKSTPSPKNPQHSDISGDLKISNLSDHVKRLKPPPALTRLNLKHGDKVVPHELSTVMEVDSPMSVKHKTITTRNDSKECNNTNESPKDKVIEQNVTPKIKEPRVNPDLLQSNVESNKPSTRQTSMDSNDDTKFQMIDLKQFNEIMLEPFISIQEYAKKFYVEPPPEEGSNVEDLRDEAITDDFSSLHSDGSLPDVIAELLKRKMITEPFKFDTVSNVNSATVSSESTLSTLALSKIRKEKKKPSVTFQNKENIGETSDVLSISSNPDLENAFKMLGMGWASSTLKKTKERLALSSSSNTSSSSTSQYKLKNFNQGTPVIVTDSVSSVPNQSQKGFQGKNATESTAKHVQKQILMNTMTVKEFLTNELAKKITFNNKSAMNETEEEFVSLFETKMPEEMKLASETQRGEVSVDSTRSGANRARTSTPVQIYKSTAYHSSSSSNISNGLFSNADDLSSVKLTSNSIKNHSTSEKDDLTIPNFSLRMKKASDCSKSD